MSGQVDLARGWLRKAGSDLATASLVVAGNGPYDTACYHAQQALEKSLKALLAFTGAGIPDQPLGAGTGRESSAWPAVWMAMDEGISGPLLDPRGPDG